MRIRTLMTCCAAVAAIGTYCASDALSQLPAQPTRPVLAVDGKPRADLTTDLQQLSWDDQTNKLEFTLNNWNAGQYKYSEGSLFSPGTTVAFYAGFGTSASRKVSEGRITEVAPHFTSSAPSTITVRIAGAAQPASSPAEALSLGGNLLEFHPVHKADGTISGTGTAANRDDLSKGITVRIERVGARFSGDYVLTGTVHTFDLSHGNRVQFTGTKAGSPHSLPSSPHHAG